MSLTFLAACASMKRWNVSLVTTERVLLQTVLVTKGSSTFIFLALKVLRMPPKVFLECRVVAGLEPAVLTHGIFGSCVLLGFVDSQLHWSLESQSTLSTWDSTRWFLNSFHNTFLQGFRLGCRRGWNCNWNWSKLQGSVVWEKVMHLLVNVGFI